MPDLMSMTFSQERNRLFPARTYWRVTCSCGRRSGRLIERDAKRWGADHLKQHQTRRNDG